jgi:large subunit ribosomal protein L23Ae
MFVVDINSTKPEIKKAITDLYGCTVKKINTLISFKHGDKRAFVRFKNDGEAVDLAGRIGIL